MSNSLVTLFLHLLLERSAEIVLTTLNPKSDQHQISPYSINT